MKKGLTIGSMIYNIFASVMYLISIPTIFIGAFASETGAADAANTFTFFAFVGLILAIINLIADKKVKIGLRASVVAIVGHSLMLLGAILSLPAVVLTILAAVFYGLDIKKKSLK